MTCSPPFKIGKAWLDAHAKDICDYHDGEWVKREWSAKFIADFVASWKFTARGVVFILCGVLGLPYFIILGTIFWTWKKYVCKS